MDWETFAAALAGDLAELPEGALVVISEREGGGRFTQCMQEEDALTAYVCDNVFLKPEDRASAEGERIIADAGWKPRDPAMGDENWSYVLPCPAPAEDYRNLTDMIVTALRDGYGIPSPEGWTYSAWNELTGNGSIALRRLEAVVADEMRTTP
ncbi:TY-Chap domain-containing protein [Actinomadura rupiterrae]|uniref:TY-Chap domain-containing protein n=1 Tax=Actinomadura rupiterrae TaxID=559627 RepID=UPI0020A37A02|nr:hypothetical protein [Actinomadura rupiterrae]MCP2343620.1 hypothetical protein [Actinomadura rupiterrae]